MMAIFLKCLFASLAILVFHAAQRRRARRVPALLQDRCSQIATYWSRDVFFHLDLSISMHSDLESPIRNHRQKGWTYLIDSLFGRTIVHTIVPENLQAVYSQGKDFGIQPDRLPAMEHFCGQGFLTTDGSTWSQSRKMLKPTFSKANISDLNFLDRETNSLISKIKDGETLDLQPLLLVMFLNTSIHFLLGVHSSSDPSGAPCTAEQFIKAFQASLFGTGLRLMLGPLRSLSKFETARQRTHDYIDHYIKQALQDGSPSLHQTYGAGGSMRQSLVHGLASQTDDIVYMRSQILQGMMASQETTAILIANTLFSLARHPKYWETLRKTVMERGESLFTFENISKFEFMQDIIKESLRLYPIFPMMSRSALRDTTLPVGGGPNQDQPIFIPKGTLVQSSFYALHRNWEVFGTDMEGTDIEDFYPGRWSKIKPEQWEYITFGGGQRACLGKEKVLAESAFVICRLVQRFEHLESRDAEPWKGQQTLTAKMRMGARFVCIGRSNLCFVFADTRVVQPVYERICSIYVESSVPLQRYTYGLMRFWKAFDVNDC